MKQLVKLLLFAMLLIMPQTGLLANDWGFAVNYGASQAQVQLTYAMRDGAQQRQLREWYLGYRNMHNLPGGFAVANDIMTIDGNGVGLGFSWRYVFRGGFFLGVRNDWWYTQYTYRRQADSLRGNGSTGINSILPAMITGWQFGGSRVSFDLLFLLGQEIPFRSPGEDLRTRTTYLGGLALRF